MAIYSTSGAKLYIGSVYGTNGWDDLPESDLTESDFTSQVWLEIKKTEGFGTIGNATDSISTYNSSSPGGRDQVLKGMRPAATMEVVAFLDTTDPGQLAIIAAEKSNSNYHFKLVFNDAPTGGTPSERKFIALVMNAAEQLDQVNNAMRLNISLTLNSNIVRKAAAAGGGGT